MAQPSVYHATNKLHSHLKHPPPYPYPHALDTLKLLCSYGGKILPRHPDGKLRYHGGVTRVLAVHRSISFTDLMTKLGELCGADVLVRCQLPNEDLDALVTVTSGEDLTNLIEEYDRAAAAAGGSLKIRIFLSLRGKSGSSSSSSSKQIPSHGVGTRGVCYRHMAQPVAAYPSLKKVPSPPCGYPTHCYLLNNGNQWR